MTDNRPARSGTYPWYDSQWLAEYARCRAVIQEVKPGTLDDFDAAMRIFQTRRDFQTRVLEHVFDSDVRREIERRTASLQPTDLELHEAQMFGRFVVHNHSYFTELQRATVPMMSEIAGEEVEPSYNFLSLYGALGVCPPHLDAPQAKWTLDFCINQSGPWPIHISRVQPWLTAGNPEWGAEDWQEAIRRAPALQFSAYTLVPGQAVVFSGSSQWHYRDAIPAAGLRQFSDVLFFHFIPKGTAELVKPENWARIFGIPELAEPSPP